MDVFSTVIDIYSAFMPNDEKKLNADKWKQIAQRNAMVIVGMVLGSRATLEQLKQMKEIIEKQSIR